MTNHLTRRARTLRAVAAFAVTLAIVAATSLVAAAAAPASTDMRCNGDNGRSYNACFSLDYLFPGWYDGHVGLDVYMPEQYGREILACGADFKATIRGDDGKGLNDPVLRVPYVDAGWPIADSTGIAVELYAPYLGPELDEDDDDYNDDELYARISFYDCHTGVTRSFRTGTLKGVDYYWGRY